jgi:4-aminobutyrate aminotransferase
MLETPISVPDFVTLAREHVSPVLGLKAERAIVRGEGHRLYGVDGRAYLDFICGIATSVLGHGHPAVNAAIHRQVDTLIHINGAGFSEPTARLAAEIAAAMPDPLDTVFFSNAGAEVIEGAVKLARRVTGRPGIVSFRGGFHGRTTGAVALTTTNLNYRAGYEPLLPSVYHAPFPDAYRMGGEEEASRRALAALRDLLTSEIPGHSVAALVLEAELGEGGYVPAPASFLRGVREICDEYGILWVADEIQCGYGRTGTMWGFEHGGVVPDVVCIAKAIANGLPLSGLVTSRALQERWGVGAHGTTFGGNPVACAAGLAVLQTIREQDLVANAAAMGRELRAGLERLAASDESIGDVRGNGLMIGVEFVTDRASKGPDEARCSAVMAKAADLGLLLLNCGTHHNVIRWIPPLNVTSDEIDEAIGIFGQALQQA